MASLNLPPLARFWASISGLPTSGRTCFCAAMATGVATNVAAVKAPADNATDSAIRETVLVIFIFASLLRKEERHDVAFHAPNPTIAEILDEIMAKSRLLQVLVVADKTDFTDTQTLSDGK